MRICIIAGSYYKDGGGGAEIQSFLIGRELGLCGHKIYYLAINSIGGKPSFEMDEGIEVYRVRKSANLPRYFVTINKLFLGFKPDICYNRTAGEMLIAFMLCRLAGIPLVLGLSSDIDCMPYAFWRLITFHFRAFLKRVCCYVNQFIMRKADRVISQTAHQKQMLNINFNIKNIVIKNGICVPGSPEQKEENPPVVAWLSNLKPFKGAERFVDLAKQCADLNCRFILAGYAADKNYCAQILKSMKGSDNIEYVGGLTLEETYKFINRASVFVFTSAREGFPNVLIQAWARGVPTISLFIDPDNAIKENKLGFCSGDFAQMVKDARFLIENREMCRIIGERARAYVFKNHDIKKIALEYEAIFKSLTENKANG